MARVRDPLEPVPLSRSGRATPGDDDALMSRWLAGDVGAFDHLYERYATSVCSLLCFLGASRDDAESLTQETFFRLIRSRSRYDPSLKFSAWLFSIARNLWRDELRRRRCRPVPFQAAFAGTSAPDEPAPVAVLGSATPGNTPEIEAGKHEQWTHLLRALDHLPQKQQEVLVLRYLQGIPADEIAQVVNIPLATVRTRLHRGVAALREAVRDPS